jgi:hypothetical protein
LNDWTCRAHNNRTSIGNIIDWVVSANCTSEADISVADKPYDYVQMTDHRAVLASLFMKSPQLMNAMPNIPINLVEGLHIPRGKYPSKRDKAKFYHYRQQVDRRVTAVCKNNETWRDVCKQMKKRP